MHDMMRLESYAKNMVDYHVCMDLLPTIARAFLLDRIPVNLSIIQTALLVAVGLQHRSIDELSIELGLPATQLLALFNRAMRKIVEFFRTVEEQHTGSLLPSQNSAPIMTARATTVDQELDEAAKEVNEDLKRKQDELISSLSLEEYTVDANVMAFDDALKSGKAPSTISVKSGKRPADDKPSKKASDKKSKTSDKHKGKKNKKQKT
ncbi:hypothetical protein SARC_14639 [Sphaeroforma arctica JP610]|uniref:Possible tRNA binding domain-containing protein n=1 Tax=Sphaeroforma arctica JP610 TaxID=667725 RepID=A0A0L0F9L7_9EUKA|nr:hypothetical protein SARC_14639 [Sphaeroforma arctica JP610]KNC72803.1 hypothetical protein SARC_14639 [Sphaeroforma arctica JP610]|eukprot:XP_014146705.1 hypothetical protein SARC_14639 [Sphaeroforma arctica JP610]